MNITENGKTSAPELSFLRPAAPSPNLDARATASATPARQNAGGPRYAGFWVRFLAYLIDGCIVLLPISVLYGVACFALFASYHTSSSSPGAFGSTIIVATALLAVVTGFRVEFIFADAS